jgi:O-antigen/teichoic acid export membrane protein
MNGSVKKNITYQIIYRILTIITPLITSPYLARILGAEALGRYSASYAYVNYFMLFAMLGIEKYGSRSIAKIQGNRKQIENAFWNIYLVQLSSSFISIIGYIIFVEIFVPHEIRILYYLQGLWLISSLLDINWLYFGLEQFKLTVIRNSIIKVLTVVAILLVVKMREDLWKYVVIMSGSMILSQIVLWASIHKFVGFKRPVLSDCKEHLKPIFKMFIPILAISVFHIMDKTMLNLLSNDVNSGYYYNADKLVNIPLGVITAMSTVLLPKMANTFHTKGEQAAQSLLKKSSELSMFLICSISFGIGAVAKTFVPFFFGPGYEECIILLRWFVPVLVIKAFSDFSREQYLIPKSKDNVYIIAVVVGAIFNLISNYFLIRKYAAKGAVIGTLIAEIAVLIVQLIGVSREMNFIKLFAFHSIYILFAIAMYASVQFVDYYASLNGLALLVVEIIVGGMCYLMLSAIYWKINKSSIFHYYIARKIIKTKEKQ